MSKENNSKVSRRNLLKSTVVFGTTIAAIPSVSFATKQKSNFSYCLNTSTISKQNLGLMAEIELAAKTGFDGIEIWIRTIEAFIKSGGKLADVKQKAKDLGIVIEDAIGFAKWIVDDEVERNSALDQIKREMDILAQIGCKRIAAPPFGATLLPKIDLKLAAKRYHDVCEIGKSMNVQPQLELWGFSENMHLFGETLLVASESGVPNACILADVYHLFKGGSQSDVLNFIDGQHLQIFHMNDYPLGIERKNITDGKRIMPGDGVAPITQILKDLNKKNTPIVLSLELFNEEYWKMNADEVAKIGLLKMKKCVSLALN